MDSLPAPGAARLLGIPVGVFMVIAVALPLLPALVLGYSLAAVLALMGSGFVIEYGAAPVGIALGLDPFYVFYVLLCTETGLFLLLYGIFDLIGHTYAPVTRFLERTHTLVHRSRLVERYGILGLFPAEIILGVYFNAPVSWVLGWQREKALVITIAGYCCALAVTIVTTIGLLGAFFPGAVSP